MLTAVTRSSTSVASILIFDFVCAAASFSRLLGFLVVVRGGPAGFLHLTAVESAQRAAGKGLAIAGHGLVKVGDLLAEPRAKKEVTQADQPGGAGRGLYRVVSRRRSPSEPNCSVINRFQPERPRVMPLTRPSDTERVGPKIARSSVVQVSWRVRLAPHSQFVERSTPSTRPTDSRRGSLGYVLPRGVSVRDAR